MKVETSRFGQIEVDEDKVIHMIRPVLGFDALRRFIIILPDQKTPFCWLQSVEDSKTAFVIVNPRIFKPDYKPALNEYELQGLEIVKAEDVVVMAIVTIRSQPLVINMNLRAPIVINAACKLAGQIVLDNADYPVRYPVPTIEAGHQATACHEIPDQKPLHEDVIGLSHAMGG